MQISLPELGPGDVSSLGQASGVHSLDGVCRKHANGVFTCERSSYSEGRHQEWRTRGQKLQTFQEALLT